MDRIAIEKGSVQETLVIPLYARHVLAQMHPELYDGVNTGAIVDRVDYDFRDQKRLMDTRFGQFGALEVAQREYDLCEEARAYLAAQEDSIALVTSAAEMHAAHDEGRAAAFLSIEDVSVMGSHVDELYDRGIRFCMLAWNHDNAYACGADFDQRRGLTQRGRALVCELLAQGVVMDISHLSDAGAEDLFSMTDAPVMASHSDVRAVCNMARNLARWQIDELIRRRGLIGLNFYRYFIGGDYTLDALLRHADAILEAGGEDVLAIGGDIDGCYGDLPVGFEGIQSMPAVRAAFVSAFGEELAEKIFYANAEAFIDRVL